MRTRLSVPGNFRLAVQRFVFGLSLLVPILAGAEDARLPYSYLYRLQKTQADLAAAYPDLEIFLRLESLSPEVKPGDIHAFINSKSGKIPIRIGQQGGFSVPMRDDLLEVFDIAELEKYYTDDELAKHSGRSA